MCKMRQSLLQLIDFSTSAQFRLIPTCKFSKCCSHSYLSPSVLEYLSSQQECSPQLVGCFFFWYSFSETAMPSQTLFQLQTKINNIPCCPGVPQKCRAVGRFLRIEDMYLNNNLMKQQVNFKWNKQKYYRCRPSLYQSVVVGDYLVDIDGTRLFLYQVDGMVFQDSIQVLNKDEQFCAKVRPVNNQYLAVFGLYRVVSVSLKDKQVVDDVEIPTMIEKVEAGNGYATVLTSDQDGENKLIYCWKIDAHGKFQKKFDPVEVHLPEYEECDDELLELAIIQSIDHSPKIYLYWRGSNQMLEVDPTRKLEERYNRVKELNYVIDIDHETYSEITGTKIVLCSKKGGKELGTFTNEQQQFKKVISQKAEPRNYFSISNKGVKKWKLEPNAVPVFYANSEEYPVENLYITDSGSLVGINLEKRWILVWKNELEVIIHSFPNEVIKKIIKMSDTQACLMLEATISKEVENEFTVEKHNKMEVYDFSQDKEIAKKAVLKLQYKIDVDSSIVASDNSILFILNEDCENQLKKHIFRWWPFAEDKKKEIKKREIIGGAKFDTIKLHAFDRILTFKLAQNQEMYDLFGKVTQGKSQVTLFDFSAKKIGDYELGGDIVQIQLSSRNQLFALGKQKFAVYEINTSSKNRLEKVYELQMVISYIHPFGDYLLMKKQGTFFVYDKDFQLLMKEQESEEVTDYRLLKVDESKFALVSTEQVSLWDLEKQEKTHLQVSKCEPNLVELMSNHLVLADKWIKSYDFQSLRK